MADTGTTRLSIRQPETGQYNNSWGDVLNDDMMQLFDDAITGETAVALGAATTYSLGALVLGVSGESRFMCLKITGTPASAVTITVPASITKKWYLVDNQCGQTVTLKYSASSGVTIATGVRFLVWCDGAEVYSISALATNATSLGGIAAANYARLDIANLFAGTNRHAWAEVTEAATTIINAAAGNHQRLILTANRQIGAPSNPADGVPILLQIVQDGTGGRTITAWNSVFHFDNGLTPTLGAAPNAADLFLIVYDALYTRWIVSHLASAGPELISSSDNVVLAANENNVNVFERAGSPAGVVTVTCTVMPGVRLGSDSTQEYALDFRGFVSGSTINFVNNGRQIGKGGRGGRGGWIISVGDDFGAHGAAGEDGGSAVIGPGLGRTFNVTNANGRMSGGGGGGGGGGTSGDNGSVAAGGGGGGGAGCGPRGDPGTAFDTNEGAAQASPGVAGSWTAQGSGGAGAQAAGATGGAGGDGGALGAAGAAGTGPTGQAVDIGAGAAGAAGKAIELNGGTITWISGSGNVDGAVT